jgi:VanZ family protein
MDNAVMLVPLGFLYLGLLWKGNGYFAKVLAILVALSVGAVVIVAVKFAQVYFPPRTLHLSYIIAQSAGFVVGCALWMGWQIWLGSSEAHSRSGANFSIKTHIVLYLFSYFFVVFFPFTFILSIDDLSIRVAALPSQLVSLPGTGRPPVHRLAMLAGHVALVMPFGGLLSMLWWRHRHGLLAAGLVGAGLGVASICAELLVIGGASHLITPGTHALGAGLGYAVGKWLRGGDPQQLRDWLAFAAVILAVPYLLAFIVMKDLVTSEWRTLDQAVAAIVPRGSYPFYHHYLVSKSKALSSLIAHAIIFAPVGLAVWACRPVGATGGKVVACALAALLAGLIEVGRQFKPGLHADIANVIIGGAAAATAHACADALWRTIASRPTIHAGRMSGHAEVRGPTARVPAR